MFTLSIQTIVTGQMLNIKVHVLLLIASSSAQRLFSRQATINCPGGSRVGVLGPQVSTKGESITRIWGLGVRGQSHWSRGQAFLHLYNPRSWPICPKICFGRTKKLCGTFVGEWPSWFLNAPVINSLSPSPLF